MLSRKGSGYSVQDGEWEKEKYAGAHRLKHFEHLGEGYQTKLPTFRYYRAVIVQEYFPIRCASPNPNSFAVINFVRPILQKITNILLNYMS